MENESEDHGDVFRIPDLWRPSDFLKLVPNYDSFLFTKINFNDSESVLPEIVDPSVPESSFFSIPALSLGPPVETPNAEQLPLQHKQSQITDDQDQEQGQLGDSDFWLLPYEIPLKSSNYHTWNAFQHPQHKEPSDAYISEAGAHVFDSAVAGKEDYLQIKNSGYTVVTNRKYVEALVALGLGRSSSLFSLDEKTSTFKPTHKQLRISGYSGETLLDLSSMFVDCGNTTIFLRHFVDSSYRKQLSPGRIALAEVLSSILVDIEKELSRFPAASLSLLQLQRLFKPAHVLLVLLRNVVEKIQSSKDDETMLSTIFEEAQTVEDHTESLREVLLEIFSRVSKPWLEFSSQWLGLQRESGLPMSKTGTSKAFVKVESKEWINEQGEELREPDYTFDLEKVPSFMIAKDAQLMFDVGRSLRLLRTHHPDHALAQDYVFAASKPPVLNFEYAWENILSIEAKARKYEQDLIASLAICETQHQERSSDHTTASNETPYNLDFFGKPVEDMEAHFLTTIDTFDRIFQNQLPGDKFSTLMRDYLQSLDLDHGRINTTSISRPALSLIPSLSFNPLIAAQARVVNGTVMRLLFKSHNLREHLSIQRQFHLLGNGVFSSRLSHALFDPELETAERHRGVARSGAMMGLRLGGRNTWPPASSELRLALMGVLTESYTPVIAWDKVRCNTFLDEASIPGDLSFAVRDMSEEEMQACRNANSLQALDFLRLSYKAPGPLGVIITPVILYKYDQIFRLLLRVFRMLYVVSALFRNTSKGPKTQSTADLISHRFRIEAQHFVSGIADYFFESGIKATWRIFDDKLDQVEARILDDQAYSLAANEGIDNLRDYHEMVLDKIMFALLLRKRQQAVMNLLEEIFTLILQYSECSVKRPPMTASESDLATEKRQIYTKFKQKVGVFVNVCRGMTEKKGYGEKQPSGAKVIGQHSLFDGTDLVEENTIPQLLLRLDMFRYYA